MRRARYTIPTKAATGLLRVLFLLLFFFRYLVALLDNLVELSQGSEVAILRQALAAASPRAITAIIVLTRIDKRCIRLPFHWLELRFIVFLNDVQLAAALEIVGLWIHFLLKEGIEVLSSVPVRELLFERFLLFKFLCLEHSQFLVDVVEVVVH